MFGRPPTRLQLEVPLSPERAEERLRSSMRIVRSLLLSPAWGAVEPFLGRVGPGFFEMRVHHGYSNGLTRLLYGRRSPTPREVRIEAQFATLWWVVLILRLVWLALLVDRIERVAAATWPRRSKGAIYSGAVVAAPLNEATPYLTSELTMLNIQVCKSSAPPSNSG